MKKVKNTLNSILIGGTSHSGKSTLAKSIASKLGYEYLSTDSLARHPGRPWKERPEWIPAHVREHYTLLTVDELVSDVLNHYDHLWSTIYGILKSNDIQGKKMVLEGSALWPTKVKEHNLNGVWLTASNEVLKDRIYSSSSYPEKTLDEQKLIDKFLARTLRFNEMMMVQISNHQLSYINVENFSDIEELTDYCIEMLILDESKDT